MTVLAMCHILPCNVDFEGMAITHVFFRPQTIEAGVLAGSVRGRGLLATTPTKPEDPATEPHLVLLSLNDDNLKTPIVHSQKSCDY